VSVLCCRHYLVVMQCSVRSDWTTSQSGEQNVDLSRQQSKKLRCLWSVAELVILLAFDALFGWQEGHLACKKLGVGLFMVTIWLELWTSYISSCHHHFRYPWLQWNLEWRHSGTGFNQLPVIHCLISSIHCSSKRTPLLTVQQHMRIISIRVQINILGGCNIS